MLTRYINSLWSLVSTKTSLKNRVYVDYAAATPIHPEVFKVMSPYFNEYVGNPSAIHSEGLQLRDVIEACRITVATTLSIRNDLVTFTSGGTEANNIAIIGYINTLLEKGVSSQEMEVISIKTEHPATLQALEEIKKLGVTVHFINCTEDGRVDIEECKAALNEKTVLVTLAYVNSEIGVIQPIRKLSKIIRKVTSQWNDIIPHPCFHIDAAQAPLWLSCNMEQLGVDAISLDASKFEGPRSSGVYACSRRQWSMQGVLFGGSQEQGIRPGTESPAMIVGFTKALSLAQEQCELTARNVKAVRDTLLTELLHRDSYVVKDRLLLNGSEEFRVANNINVSLPGYDTEYLAIYLDKKGFSVSTKSACSSHDSEASSVVFAVTGDTKRAQSTLRITLGPNTAWEDIKYIPKHIADFVTLQDSVTL